MKTKQSMFKKLTASLILSSILAQASLAEAKELVYISIPCGGMFGYIPARVLASLEEIVGPLKPDGLIGSSTGSIIATLAASEKPYSFDQISKFYEQEGTAVFGSMIGNSLMNFFSSNKSSSSQILQDALQKYLGSQLLSGTKIPLFVPAFHLGSKTMHTFNSAMTKWNGSFDTQLASVPTASCSIAEIFGAATVQFQDSRQEFYVDPGSQMAGGVCDPTPWVYPELVNGLKVNDTAVIYYVGTGFQKGTNPFTYVKNKKVRVVHLEPDLSSYAKGQLPMLMAAADGSPENLQKMKKIAEQVTQGEAFNSMLFSFLPQE